MTGVSIGKPRGQDPWAILAIAADAKGTAERLTKLTEATLFHEKAVKAHGTADTIDSVLSQAKAKHAEKIALLDSAEKQAKEIVKKGEERAKALVDEARAANKETASALKARLDKVLEQERKATAREEEIAPMHEDAAKTMTEAKTLKSEGERLKSTYEVRVRKLKEAMKDAR